MQQDLSFQSLSKANLILGRKDGKPVPLIAVSLCFEIPIEYEKVPVQAYVSNNT
jgi:hypothetical protein